MPFVTTASRNHRCALTLAPSSIRATRDLRHEALNLARATVPSRHPTLPPSQCRPDERRPFRELALRPVRTALHHVKRLTRTDHRHGRNPFPPSAERGSRNVDDLDPTSPHRILGRERVVHPAKPRDQIIARIGCEHRNQIDVAHVHIKIADYQRPEQVESRQRRTGGLANGIANPSHQFLDLRRPTPALARRYRHRFAVNRHNAAVSGARSASALLRSYPFRLRFQTRGFLA